MFKEKEIRLPTDTQALDGFVSGIIRDFGLPPGDDTFEAIATMILHLDNRIGRVKRSYFADGAVKFLANKAAFEWISAKQKQEKEAQQAQQQASKSSGDSIKQTFDKATGTSDVPKPIQNT